jgi:two-component system, OmpR family, sensor histidine kinase QseC
MIKSIRTFLLVNLLLSVTLITSLAVIGNLFLEHKRFLTHLDAQLTLAAYTIESFLDEKADPDDIISIQKRINEIPEAINRLHYDLSPEMTKLNILLKSIQFQIWNRNNRLILTSYAAPNMPMVIQSENVGFDNVWKDNIPWRVFSIYNPSSGFRIVVLQRNTFRTELEKQITWDSLMVMAIIYPFLGLLIWVIVGRGLESITKTAKELKRRSNPNQLKPLKQKNLPKEIKPLVEELNHMLDGLQKAFLREKRFASDAAHELRTPLAGMAIQAQVAEQASNKKERDKALKSMLKCVDNCSHIIQQLLTLSRMMPDASINQSEKIKLNPLIRESVKNLAQVAETFETQIQIKCLTPSPELEGNKTALLILMRNLIDNAIRYSPKNSVVRVESLIKNGRPIFQVIDQGQGISEKLKERVFERFYRGSQDKIPGSGLGLGIVRQIVDLHKADIKLNKGADGKGLCAEIHFKPLH